MNSPSFADDMFIVRVASSSGEGRREINCLQSEYLQYAVEIYRMNEVVVAGKRLGVARQCDVTYGHIICHIRF
jgi:hypothetical protein